MNSGNCKHWNGSIPPTYVWINLASVMDWPTFRPGTISWRNIAAAKGTVLAGSTAPLVTQSNKPSVIGRPIDQALLWHKDIISAGCQALTTFHIHRYCLTNYNVSPVLDSLKQYFCPLYCMGQNMGPGLPTMSFGLIRNQHQQHKFILVLYIHIVVI